MKFDFSALQTACEALFDGEVTSAEITAVFTALFDILFGFIKTEI